MQSYWELLSSAVLAHPRSLLCFPYVLWNLTTVGVKPLLAHVALYHPSCLRQATYTIHVVLHLPSRWHLCFLSFPSWEGVICPFVRLLSRCPHSKYIYVLACTLCLTLSANLQTHAEFGQMLHTEYQRPVFPPGLEVADLQYAYKLVWATPDLLWWYCH